jgi:hypothetical protein
VCSLCDTTAGLASRKYSAQGNPIFTVFVEMIDNNYVHRSFLIDAGRVGLTARLVFRYGNLTKIVSAL